VPDDHDDDADHDHDRLHDRPEHVHPLLRLRRRLDDLAVENLLDLAGVGNSGKVRRRLGLWRLAAAPADQ
jgi:hypothetical protein